MPYLMGGFPTSDGSRAIGEAYAEAGADLVELGVPFSDPLADGPVIHAAGTAALAAGATLHGVLEVGRALAEPVPVVLMCYANLVFARGVERFADELAERGISGLIVPDLPLEEAARRSPPATPPASRSSARRADDAGRAARRDRRPRARLRLHGLGDRHDGRARGRADQLPAILARDEGRTDVPVALGFGIGTPEAAAAAADAGADGVIVGSRLVRAAARGRRSGAAPTRCATWSPPTVGAGAAPR